jgi:hypothetical protein
MNGPPKHRYPPVNYAVSWVKTISEYCSRNVTCFERFVTMIWYDARFSSLALAKITSTTFRRVTLSPSSNQKQDYCFFSVPILECCTIRSKFIFSIIFKYIVDTELEYRKDFSLYPPRKINKFAWTAKKIQKFSIHWQCFMWNQRNRKYFTSHRVLLNEMWFNFSFPENKFANKNLKLSPCLTN